MRALRKRRLAGRASGPLQVLIIAVAMLTVVLSWTVVNTVYTLRYAHLYFRPPAEGIDFTDPAAQKRPDYLFNVARAAETI
jgi:uncharacterized membrane protein